MFHWGPTGWAFYCLPTVAIGHAYYVRRQPHMRVSSACHAVLGRRTDGVVGPWTTLAGGFGARPVHWLSLEAFGGPEWAMADGGRWRTGVTLGTVFGGGHGAKTVRRKPTRKPG